MRGENPHTAVKPIRTNGTSPRARGKHSDANNQRGIYRNIPACAGKTHAEVLLSALIPEHPRVRGENYGCAVHDPHHRGTSPRARGKHNCFDRPLVSNRNIPACAGKTGRHGRPAVRLQEHPRVRGENYPPPHHRRRWCGTSPRARGKRSLFRNEYRHCGNIPACAGKTPGRPRRV